jgi:hypothetical protein
MTTTTVERPDHNSLGKAAFILGLIGLVMAFVPVIGFVSWILAPLAILCGVIALRKPRRSLAIAGIVTGALALMVCFWWINAAKAVGEAVNKDTFNTTGQAADLSKAPIIDATIKGLWTEMEDNKVAAGTKYGGHRLRFAKEKIADFQGDAASPAINIVGKTEDYLIHFVTVSFAASDGAKIAGLKKGGAVSFVCESVKEGFGDGYNLGGCKLQ